MADLVDALIDRGHDVTLLGAGESATSAQFLPLWDSAIPEMLGHPLPEVVHGHTLSGPLNAPIYRGLGLPAVVTVHGPVDADLHDHYRDLGDDVKLVAISERQRASRPTSTG